MTLVRAGRLGRRAIRVRLDRPALVVLLCSAAAWVALILLWAGAGGIAGGGHAHPAGSTATFDPWTPGWLGAWLLMVLAMMWPLTITTVRTVARASYRRWRWRLTAVTIATGTALWLCLGLAAATVAQVARVPADSAWWQLAFLALAMVASRSARRARLLWKCLDLPPVAPGGRRGLSSAARAGIVSWRRCALLCAPVMIAMVVGHSPLVLIAASLSVWWEALHPRAWRDPVPLLLLGLAALVVAPGVFTW